MCGIVGEFAFGTEPSGADWPRLINSMARRGPDDEGLWADQRRCTLGFRRLAILDLSPTGHQPLVSPDGAFALVLNGEIYNFRELRAELIQRGIRFRSTGDAEVVLYALAEWGPSVLDRFNGMFALAFYSARSSTLLLARDHAGIKPLYALHDARGCVFASQFDQILAHPWAVGRNVSSAGRALYLRLGYIPAPHAMIEGAEMIVAGSWLEVRADGSSRRGRYFEFPRTVTADLSGSEAYEAVDAAVASAVRRQMVSDVPVGAFLSGGVDSPLVAAKMVASNGVGIPAFTVGTEDASLDESADASRYANELGLEHYVRLASSTEVLNLVPSLMRSCAEPFADYSLFPTMLVSRLAAEHVKVVLSGDGGDELFWGYSYRFSRVLGVAEEFRQPRWVRNARWGAAKYLGLGSPDHEIRRSSIGDWYRSRHSRIPENRLRRIFPSIDAWPESVKMFDYRKWREDETAQWLRWNEFIGHLAMVLLKVDRASMYHSVEVRVPLLDREVIATALRVDWKSCLDVAQPLGKLPLRWALERHVRNPTIPKRGFSVPMGAWLRGPLRPLFEERLFDRRELAGLPLDKRELREWFAVHCSGVADHAWGLWVLLSLALWEDEYLSPKR